MSRRNLEREEAIVKQIKEGIPYKEIGEEFGITKQRVYQFAVRHGISRWKESKARRKDLHRSIVSDIENELTYKEIVSKYSVNKDELHRSFKEHTGIGLGDFLRNKRNNLITNSYLDGDTAKVITKKENKVLDSPLRVGNINTVYIINRKAGVKRYPQIGLRHLGGCFEDKKILRYIVDKHDNKEWSYDKIAKKLNKLGYRTITGVEFTGANVYAKYKTYKKNKGKRLKY